jgi:hypothetical protein
MENRRGSSSSILTVKGLEDHAVYYIDPSEPPEARTHSACPGRSTTEK